MRYRALMFVPLLAAVLMGCGSGTGTGPSAMPTPTPAATPTPNASPTPPLTTDWVRVKEMDHPNGGTQVFQSNLTATVTYNVVTRPGNWVGVAVYVSPDGQEMIRDRSTRATIFTLPEGDLDLAVSMNSPSCDPITTHFLIYRLEVRQGGISGAVLNVLDTYVFAYEVKWVCAPS